MFTDRHYVPAIRWRQGEFGALEDLRPHQRKALTPLVDVPSIPWDFVDEQPAKKIDQHITKIPAQMAKAWGIEAPIFVDLGLVDNALRMADGRHPVDSLFERLSSLGIQAIPVTATDRDADYQDAVRLVATRDGRGVCLRASIDDLTDGASIGLIDKLAETIDVKIAVCDLILDFRATDAAQVMLLHRFVLTTLPQFSNLLNYRTLTMLSGAFPVNLSSVSPGISLIPRSDWALWLSLRTSALPRIPAYGDYTAGYPDQEEVDPRIMQASASIRYAGDTDWVIVKGRAVRNPRFGGFSQFNSLSSSLVAHHMFTGHSFSWASDFVNQCALGGPTGNLTTWRKVATNRHMARVAHQIASLP